MKTQLLPLASLIPDPENPRREHDEGDLVQLVDSIRARGLLLPLRVKPADAAGRHVIVSGHRRHAALLQLGATTAPCLMVDGPLDDATVLAEQLAENIHRENLSPVAEAMAYRRYITIRGITASQAAKELHVDASRLSRLLPLLALPEEIRNGIDQGQIPQETAYYLSRVPEGEERTRLMSRAVAGKLTRDESARAAKKVRTSALEGSSVSRVAFKLTGGRTVSILAGSVQLGSLIETLEEILKEARKARQQSLDVTTLAKIFRDRLTAGGAS